MGALDFLGFLKTPLFSLTDAPTHMPDAPSPNLELSRSDIESLVGTPVDDLLTYQQALTHRSRLQGEHDESLRSNERLEFVGDALLDFIIAEELYQRFPQKNEGYLTRLRAKLVSGKALARYARRLDVGEHLLLSANAERDRGRNNPSILADAFEALLAALYFDQGYDRARQFVVDRILGRMDLTDVARHTDNYKSLLLEAMQADGRPQPTYRVIREEGPSHDKTFTVEALVGDEPHGRGTASSKKAAEQEAAAEALRQLKDDE